MAELAYLTLLGNWKVEHHAHHLVNHRVELVLRDVDLIEAARGAWHIRRLSFVFMRTWLLGVRKQENES